MENDPSLLRRVLQRGRNILDGQAPRLKRDSERFLVDELTWPELQILDKRRIERHLQMGKKSDAVSVSFIGDGLQKGPCRRTLRQGICAAEADLRSAFAVRARGVLLCLRSYVAHAEDADRA